MTGEPDRPSWWSRVDWLGAIAETVVTLAGPIGAPLTFLLRVREDLAPEELPALNEEASRAVTGPVTTTDFRRLLGRALPDPDPAAVVLYGSLLEEAVAVAGTQERSPEEVGRALADRLRHLSQAVHGNPKPLRRALAEHFSLRPEIVSILQDAKIKPGEVNLNENAELTWGSALDRIKGDNPLFLLLLLAEVAERRPAVAEFKPGYWLD